MSPPSSSASHKQTPPWVTLLAGLSSGLFSTLLLQPFDVAKTTLINPEQRGNAGMMGLFKRIHAQDGITGLWRGVGPALVRISIGSGVYFTVQTQLLSQIRQQMAAQGSAANAPLSFQALLGVGFMSRASAVAVCCPISVVKTRIEGNAVAPYRGLLDGLATILRTEGVRGLYTGLLPSVLKDSPYSAVYLLCYSRLKSHLSEMDATVHFTDVFNSLPFISSLAASSGGAGTAHPVIQFSAAFLAGGFSTTLFQPAEVIKTRLQLAKLQQFSNNNSAASVKANEPPASLNRHRVFIMTQSIYREDGVKGYFRGLLPRIIRRSLSNACGWMLFEQMVQFWSGTTGL